MTERTAIATARDAAGLSQEALAEKVGVTRWTINRIEQGARDPSFDLMQKIVAALDGRITLNDFGASQPALCRG